MDGLVLTIFLLASFLGGLTSGVAGFAMGLVVSGVYLHFLTPLQTAALIVGLRLCDAGLWRLVVAARGAMAKCGAVHRRRTDRSAGGHDAAHLYRPAYMRVGVGVLLVAYSVYSLVRPAIKLTHEDVSTEVGVGFLNGLLAGLTGLVGIVVVIWCQLRNWPKDVQRAIFQPVLLATILTSTVSLTVAGAVTAET